MQTALLDPPKWEDTTPLQASPPKFEDTSDVPQFDETEDVPKFEDTLPSHDGSSPPDLTKTISLPSMSPREAAQTAAVQQPSSLWETANTPLTHIAGTTLYNAIGGPEEEKKYLADNPGTGAKVLTGAAQGSANFVDSMVTPLGLATMGAGPLVAKLWPAAGRAIAGLFVANSLKEKPEQLRQLKSAIDRGDTQQATRLGMEMGAGTVMDAVMAKHALTSTPTPEISGEPTPTTPEPSENVFDKVPSEPTPTEQDTPNQQAVAPAPVPPVASKPIQTLGEALGPKLDEIKALIEQHEKGQLNEQIGNKMETVPETEAQRASQNDKGKINDQTQPAAEDFLGNPERDQSQGTGPIHEADENAQAEAIPNDVEGDTQKSVAQPSYRQSKIDWGLNNIPFGESATPDKGNASAQVMAALDGAGIGVRDRLRMIAGEIPFPTKDQFQKGVDNKYYYDGVDALQKVTRELSSLGLDAKSANLPKIGDFNTPMEFFEAASELESRMRQQGASMASALVETGNMEKPFSKTDFNHGGAQEDLPAEMQSKSKANNSPQAGWGEGFQKLMKKPEMSGDLQMAVIPGAKEFVEQDVIPTVKNAAKGVADSMDELKSAFNAPNKSPVAEQEAGIVRHNAAELAQKDVQTRAAMSDAQKMFDKAGNKYNLQFIDKMENGQAQASPELSKIAQQMRSAFDDRVAQVRALGTGKLEKLIENYFPHLWEQPAPARGLYSRIFGKRPLEGPKSFLKQRTIPTTADGIAAGLKPVSYNPVELTLLKLHEMDRYIMAHKILNEMKDAGLAKFVKATEMAPDGHTKIDDRIGDVYEGTTAQGSLAKRGSYYAPDDAAKILNNYLSPGLRKYALFRAGIGANNVLNQAQLGLSAYHLRFTAIDSAVSKLALGIEQASRGDFSNALKSAGVAATAPVGGPAVENLIRGNKVLKEYTKPGSVGGQFPAIVDALVKGGGRVQMDKFYKNSAVEGFHKALAEGNYPGALLRAPFAALETVSKPIMEVAVPRMKLGIFADMAKDWMDRNPGATMEDQRKQYGEMWDSVDNRMGQMVYDNMFWNKTLKDTGQLATRSLGWNLGTLRELGGGIKDTATMKARIQSGDAAMTHRMAYTIALPIITGMLGAMHQYLHTGKGPDDLSDYFLPKTGFKLPNGQPERVILPTYMKDILPVVKAGQNFGTFGIIGRLATMAIHKAGPLFNMFGSMAINKDFYGTEIMHKNDPFMKQVADELKFVAGSFKPFTLQGAQHRVDDSGRAKYESLTGIMPAPAELTRTKAMQMISDYNGKFNEGGRTQAEEEAKEERYQMKDKLSKGVDVSEPDMKKRQDMIPKSATDELDKLVLQKVFTQAQARGMIKSALFDPRLTAFKKLPEPVAKEVFNAGTPQERALWKDSLMQKMAKKDDE